jgi:chemotaxis receptor (MCP) glutamine deamidase CheD
MLRAKGCARRRLNAAVAGGSDARSLRVVYALLTYSHNSKVISRFMAARPIKVTGDLI